MVAITMCKSGGKSAGFGSTALILELQSTFKRIALFPSAEYYPKRLANSYLELSASKFCCLMHLAGNKAIRPAMIAKQCWQSVG